MEELLAKAVELAAMHPVAVAGILVVGLLAAAVWGITTSSHRYR